MEEDIILDIVSTVSGNKEIRVDNSLSSLDIDSLDIIEIIGIIEGTFNIIVPSKYTFHKVYDFINVVNVLYEGD